MVANTSNTNKALIAFSHPALTVPLHNLIILQQL